MFRDISRRRVALLEKLRAYLLRAVNEGADQNMRSFIRIVDVMGLEAEAPVARSQLVHGVTNPREIRDEPKGALQARMVCFGLIRPESRFGKDVNVDQLRASAD